MKILIVEEDVQLRTTLTQCIRYAKDCFVATVCPLEEIQKAIDLIDPHYVIVMVNNNQHIQFSYPEKRTILLTFDGNLNGHKGVATFRLPEETIPLLDFITTLE